VRRGLTSTAITVLVLGGMVLPFSIRAQEAQPTVQELQKEIRQRDAVIQSLVRRVEHLERQMATGTPDAADKPATGARRVAKSRAVRPPSEQSEVAALDPDESSPAPKTPGKARPASAAGTTQQAARTNPAAPGQFEVSEDDAERALERTLVATGNLLVPKGFAEVEPLFGYTRRESPNLVISELNRNEFTWALDLRLGLPWESQFEIGVPYNLVQQQLTDITVAPVQQMSNRWGNSFGDLTVGVAKTFVHESGWIPDLLGRITYEIPTGPLSSNQVPLPSGQSKLSPSLTALKRQDPLVFVATGGYTKAFQSSQINPGDQINFQTGAFLATSPETTLRGVLQQNFLQNTTVKDVTFKGSDSVQSILTFGASSILGRGILVDLQVGFGLTSAAPKYSVILSSTYRFGVPGL
jgi:Putative MetA-pathway of phenol degradation